MQKVFYYPACAVLALTLGAGCRGKSAGPPPRLAGVALEQEGTVSILQSARNAMAEAPAKLMGGFGLAGAQGGARVRILKGGAHEIVLPIPQRTANQIPLIYAITTSPPDAGSAYRLRLRDGENQVVSVTLQGKQNAEIRIEWVSVILFAKGDQSAEAVDSVPFLLGSACVQKDHDEVKRLGRHLWPQSGEVGAYASEIQRFIRELKQVKPPRSIDAVGIYKSGSNWICTGNANLAAALLREKQVAARSLAVIPTTGQRLEMHRIVEYHRNYQWHRFDPSSLHRDVPMKPWQSVVMCTTSRADEELAMKPRPGVSPGCPYGQELEFLDRGLSFSGRDFFWTVAKPLAEFDPGEEAAKLAAQRWSDFLASGKLSQGQKKAATARDPAALLEALQAD